MEAADRHRFASCTNINGREVFAEAIEKDFQLAGLSWHGQLLTQTGDSSGRWKELFQEPLNLSKASSWREAGEHWDEDSFISLAVITKSSVARCRGG